MAYKHYLEDNYFIKTEILEPRDWKDLISVLERDFNVHGVFFDYTDGSLKLGFTCDARELLESEYDLNGVNGYYKYIVEEGTKGGVTAGVFDETNYIKLNNSPEYEVNQWEIEWGFVDESDGAADFQWSIGGNFTGAYGLQLQHITSGGNGIMRIFKGNAGIGVGITTDGASGNVLFPKGDYHRVRFKYLSNSNIQCWADVSEAGWVEYLPSNGTSSGTLKWNEYPSIIANGYNNGPIYSTQEFTGNISYLKFFKLDNLGRRVRELINIDFENGANGQIENKAENAPIGTNGVWFGVEGYAQISNQSDFDEIFSGLIDFTTRDYDEKFFNCEVNNSDEQISIKSRLSQKIDLGKTQSLSGLMVGQIPTQEISSLAERLGKELEIGTAQTITQQSNAVATSTSIRGTCNFTSITNTELGVFNNPIPQFIPESTITASFFTLTKEAALILNMSWDFDIDITEDQGGGTTSYSLSLVVISNKANDQGETIFSPSYSQTPSSASPYNYSDTETDNNAAGIALGFDSGIFPAGTEFRVQFLIAMGGTGTQQFTAEWTIRELSLNFVDYGVTTGLIHEWFNAHDVLNKILQVITDKQDYLYSELLGGLERGYSESGCLDSLRITNGFRLRQINDQYPKLSFGEVIKNLNALWAVGYSFEEIESPLELGLYNVTCVAHYPPEIELSIEGNLTYEIVIGDKIRFYNNPDIYGGYTISDVQYNAGLDITYIWFDYSQNENWWYSTTLLCYPLIGQVYSSVYITIDSSTTIRERLRLEPWEYFYTDNQLIDLGVVEEYTEEPFNDALYNKIDVSFKKYANDEDEPSTLEDFHTESEWVTPIKNVKENSNVLNLVLDWIGSTFMMNESIRTIFSEKPTTSHKLDDNIFFADRAEREGVFLCSFNNSDESITVPNKCYSNIMRGSDYIVVEGSSLNDGAYVLDYSQVTYNLPIDNYKIIQDALIGNRFQNETVMCTVKGFDNLFKQNAYKIEADENLSNTENLSYPSFIANQRRTIKRFLVRWSSYIKSFLSYVINPVVRNTSFVNNGSYTSAIDPYSSVCESDTYQENSDLSTFESAKFKPNIISFTKKLCDEDYNLILDAHKNKASVNNYGYIKFTSPKNEQKGIWLMQLKRSPLKRIAKFKGLEKFGELVQYPFNLGDETIYSSDTAAGADAQSVIATENGVVNSLFYYSRNTSSSIRIAIYDDNAGAPNNLLGKTAYTSNSPAAGWKELSLISSVNLTKNQVYWIAILTGFGANVAAQVQAPGSVSINISGTDFTNPAVVSGSLTRRDSMYMVVDAN